jgi:hypothetical protein
MTPRPIAGEGLMVDAPSIDRMDTTRRAITI